MKILKANSASESAREQLASRENLDPSVIAALTFDPSPKVRFVAFRRPDLPADLAAAAVVHPVEEGDLRPIALNEHLPDSIRSTAVEGLARSGDPFERCEAARIGIDLPIAPEIKHQLLTDAHYQVRSAMTGRSDLTSSELIALLNEEDFHEVDLQESRWWGLSAGIGETQGDATIRSNAARNPLIFHYGLEAHLDLAKISHLYGLLGNEAITDDVLDQVVANCIDGLGTDTSIPNLAALDLLHKPLLERLSTEDPRLGQLTRNVVSWKRSARSKEEWNYCDSILIHIGWIDELPDALQWQIKNDRKSSGDWPPSNLPARLSATFDSPPEEAFWTAVRQANVESLQSLTPQHKVLGFRLDFADVDHKLGIEIDGRAFHTGQDAFQRDREKQRQLEMKGWRILRFAAKEVQSDPEACVQQAAEWISSIRGA